jgi:uncharacterized membrane protein
MASYASRVRTDVARWVELGFIDRLAAEKIAKDVEQHERRSLSFGNILAMMAALLFAAAVLVMVSANWEAIPRLVRVAVLFGILAAGYVGGALLKNRGHSGLAEGVWIIAAATFGASIALIGQMYHLSGDESSVIITWSIATLLAAAALQSGPLTIASVGLGGAWLFWDGFEFWGNADFPYWYLLLAAGQWAVSLWTGSRAARHLLMLLAILYATLLAIDHDNANYMLVLAAISAVLFALAVFVPRPVERVVQLDGRFPLHCLIGFLAGILSYQAWLSSQTWLFAVVALVTLGGIAAALLLSGRESRGLRWIAYLGFTAELMLTYTILAGSMIGTAGLFLTAGVALGLVAFVIIRVEKRMNAAPAAEGVPA